VAGRSTRRRRAGGGSRWQHPGRVLANSFVAAIGVGTALLSLPVATAAGERASLLDAAFTAASAVCVTGLVTVDTGSYWSVFARW
jgi:Trk-type K+ transport system membrane component